MRRGKFRNANFAVPFVLSGRCLQPSKQRFVTRGNKGLSHQIGKSSWKCFCLAAPSALCGYFFCCQCAWVTHLARTAAWGVRIVCTGAAATASAAAASARPAGLASSATRVSTGGLEGGMSLLQALCTRARGLTSGAFRLWSSRRSTVVS